MCNGIKALEWTLNVKAYCGLACSAHPCKTAPLVVCQHTHSGSEKQGSRLVFRGANNTRWPRAVCFPQGPALRFSLSQSKTEIEGSFRFIQEAKHRWMKVLSHPPVGLARFFFSQQ